MDFLILKLLREVQCSGREERRPGAEVGTGLVPSIYLSVLMCMQVEGHTAHHISQCIRYLQCDETCLYSSSSTRYCLSDVFLRVPRTDKQAQPA